MSLARRYQQPMIDLGKIAGLHARDDEVHCYCTHCERWRGLDLQRLMAIGTAEYACR